MELKAVIFDMDGVLIDSELYWRMAEYSVLTDLNVKLNFADYKKNIGKRVDETVSYWYQKSPWKKKTKRDVQKDIINKATTLVLQHALLKKGAFETITYFFNKKIPLFIASTAPRSLITQIMVRLQLRQYFKYLYSGFSLKNSKPSPQIYQNLIRMFSLPLKNCLVIEDSPAGILAAKRAGLFCVALPPRHLRNDKIYKSADMVVSSHRMFLAAWRKRYEDTRN